MFKQLTNFVESGRKTKEIQASNYNKVLEQITMANGMLIRGDKILIPEKFQPALIAIAHEGHLGIEGTLKCLREDVWFPNMSKQVKEYVASCIGCAAAVPHNPPAPITNRETPDVKCSHL